jgi:hypothetical protein
MGITLAPAAQVESTALHPVSLRFSPEFELLLACCGSRDPGLAAILALPMNWELVLKLADHHRVTPVLYATLSERSDVPASIQAAICSRFRTHARKVLCFSAELARILRHFADHDIPALAHKGPALAELLCGDPAMRQFGDLDVLVRAADIPRARAALKELGYEPGMELTARQEKEYLRSGYEYVFGLNTEPNLLELQWQILPRFYAINFDMEGLFRRSVAIELDGTLHRTLGNEDLMLVLCVHAAKHEWAQLGMLRDIAALARLDLDWVWIEAEARKLGIENILNISLLLMHRLFGHELPLKPFPVGVSELARSIQSRLVEGIQSEAESLRYFRTMIRVRERWRDRSAFCCRLVATPSINEWEAISLPDSLFWLYRGVRLLRLTRSLYS